MAFVMRPGGLSRRYIGHSISKLFSLKNERKDIIFFSFITIKSTTLL